MRLQTKAWAQEGWAGAGDVGASTQTWGYKQKMHEPAKEENVEEEGMGRGEKNNEGRCKPREGRRERERVFSLFKEATWDDASCLPLPSIYPRRYP